ncbi:deoxyribodipyrimidine photo-lyase [Rhizoctonia solani]|uniref:Deoxyribodipyrimidine photo-lyase n=1 Tax=Rhizoctonia solani TaxID=456999 RepID=A0A8H8NP87_9AGAM|nr:deoxyribodipyrimidine photo-lyase [Rhizoctonia solani]QRW16282.1 deoxyribodipyrimidine photo-lyase [Rhizoctonia solani]
MLFLQRWCPCQYRGIGPDVHDLGYIPRDVIPIDVLQNRSAKGKVLRDYGFKTQPCGFSCQQVFQKAKSNERLYQERDQSTKRESSETKDELSSEVAYVQEVHGKIATAENAARVDDDPPLAKLQNAISEHKDELKTVSKGDSVIYWMRMEDMRIRDNRAFSAASNVAQELGVPLVVLFILSPGDYTSHDRSPRRIDFCLRNLAALKETLGGMDIPLYVTSHTPRKTLPDEVIKLARKWNARRIYANIEYQVDELRRDIRLIHLATMASVRAEYFSDRCVVEPGALATKEGRQYAVYSPWLKNWVATLDRDPSRLEESPTPKPNDNKTRNHPKVGDLFKCEIPESVEGFECHDRENMTLLYPAGEEAAHEVLRRFLYTKSRDSQLADASPLASGAEESSNHSRIKDYMNSRDHADADTTSRISPYLASGVISARECVRGAMKILGVKRVDAGKTSGPGVWVSEIAWRDFYTHVMAAFPRVSMGRPFQEKFADVKWETNAAHLKAWKEGKTGVPIVDAAIRQANTQGWMHNRARMITAMYLTKDLMLDWRLGEKHFMEQFIDGDLASNNGGWQWSASTGTDPQPYFRIFNPYSQSEKADPKGDYIKYFVPELKDLSGKALHDPYGHLSPSEFKKLGYPKPLVDHKEARERALRRYKNPGEK